MKRGIFAVVLLLSAAAISLSSQADSASATTATVKVQLTKWVLEPMDPAGLPWEMAGTITGGDLGTGEYTGQVLKASSANGKSAFDAIYNFAAGGRSFTASVVYNSDDATLAATVSGEVTEGDFKGAKVSGTAQGHPECPISTPENAIAPQGNPNNGLCFQLELQIETSSSGVVAAPSAGDGGLADTGGSGAGWTYAFAGLGALALLVVATAVVARRLMERE
jgi:hypothetical protein